MVFVSPFAVRRVIVDDSHIRKVTRLTEGNIAQFEKYINEHFEKDEGTATPISEIVAGFFNYNDAQDVVTDLDANHVAGFLEIRGYRILASTKSMALGLKFAEGARKKLGVR